jgi:hypothetical protein
MKTKEAAADSVIVAKLRLRLLGQAFQIFKTEAQKLTQMMKNEQRAADMVATKYNLRTKKMIFNAILAYATTYEKARMCLGVLFKKIDLWRLKKAYRTWTDNVHAEITDTLIEETN